MQCPERGPWPLSTSVNQLLLVVVANANCGFICVHMSTHTHTLTHTSRRATYHRAVSRKSLVTHSTLTRAARGFILMFTVGQCQCCRMAIKAMAQTLTASGSKAAHGRAAAEARARAKHRPERPRIRFAFGSRRVFCGRVLLLACKWLGTEAAPSSYPLANGPPLHPSRFGTAQATQQVLPSGAASHWAS